MQRLICSVIIVLTSAGVGVAASDASTFFQERVKDFGTVPRGPGLQHYFKLTNHSSRTVRIDSLRVSCGCVTAQALKDEISPGDSTYVVANMDTTRFDGIKSVTIYVKFSRPRREEVTLWVRANSRNDVFLQPESLSFGQVKRGDSPSEKIVITFLGDSGTRILNATCESNYVKPSFRVLSRQGAEVKYELSATLRDDAPVGKWYTDVWITTSSAATPRLRAPLTVEVESALTVSPRAVEMGEVKIGASVERKVIVRGVKPFKVVGVRGAGNALSVRDSTRSSKTIHVLTIRLTGEQAGFLQQALSFVTDLKADSEVGVVMTANVVP